MEGSIITRQKCRICGSGLRHIEKRKGCFCPDHPHESATRFVVRFKGLYKNTTDYNTAVRILNGYRFKADEGSFDDKDYRRDTPHGFKTLAVLYLKRKESRRSYGHIERYMTRAMDYFGQKNVKDISGADIEDYIYSIPGIRDKTRANYVSQIHDFFMWVRQRDVITLAQFPVFPKIDYELGRRKITDWATQEIILEKIREISAHINEKIWLGCDMLANYTALRPDDLRRVQENSLDEHGFLTIHYPTKRKNKFKVVRLVDDHVNEWRRLQAKYPGFPTMPFFRHKSNARGCRPDQKFGDKLFLKWWHKACEAVGVEGVTLYPGTKHTTATETAKLLGSDKALSASGLTNKAFSRYCMVENIGVFETVTTIREKKKGTVLPMKRRAVSK